MKTIPEINERIKKGQAVVLTAAEVKEMAKHESVKAIAKKVDVVTTGTFSPMCSSGAFLNVGHTQPPLKMQKATLDGVPAYGGIAAVDMYIGATEAHPQNPRFGGAHVICKLVKGLPVDLDASGQPTDCYPRTSIHGSIRLADINQAYLYNPRNCYQNYNAATNSGSKSLQTYMGFLQPGFRTVNYASSGEISPLINDPYLRTVGLGTSLFCCGTVGYVAWEGTQFNGQQERDPQTGIPIGPSATLAIVADLKTMDAEFIKPVFIPGYGISLYVSLGLPIPIIDEDMAQKVTIRNRSIKTRLIDYAKNQPVGQVNYEDLIENKVVFNGRKMYSRTMSDLRTSGRICQLLKNWILSGRFNLTLPVKNFNLEQKVVRFRQE